MTDAVGCFCRPNPHLVSVNERIGASALICERTKRACPSTINPEFGGTFP